MLTDVQVSVTIIVDLGCVERSGGSGILALDLSIYLFNKITSIYKHDIVFMHVRVFMIKNVHGIYLYCTS